MLRKTLGCGLLVLSVLGISQAQAADTIELRDFGSFHVGGELVTLSGLPVKEVQAVAGGPVRKSDPNGDYQVGQMYVQYMKLAHPKSKLPLLMWHGGGMTGVNWETKPDGNPGWQNFFLRAGFDTFVSDAVERGRSSWPRYPEIFKDAPEHRTQNAAWDMFRIGPAGGYATHPAKREAFAGTQFPVDAFDQFWKQTVPRWTSSNALALAQKAYGQLLRKVGPAIVVAHSQGGAFALDVAQAVPEQVAALILLEPSGAPDPAKVDVARLKGIQTLVVWADNYDKSKLWQTYRSNVEKYLAAVRAAGGSVDVIDLPAMGIRGNSHMLILDRNSDQIAQLVLEWAKGKGLVE